jgi:protoporphyrinogen oxidase
VVNRLLRPFFSGVGLEEDMTTSSRFVDLTLRMFARGSSADPANGMQQMAEQLASRLPAGSVHLENPVRNARAREVGSDAGLIGSRTVVIAGEADNADALLGGARGATTWKGVTTVYHAAGVPPVDTPTLLLDTDVGPINNTVAVSNAAPSYAPPGQALVATSMVHDSRTSLDEAAIRTRLAATTRDWDHLATYDVPRALPAVPACPPGAEADRLGVASDRLVT